MCTFVSQPLLALGLLLLPLSLASARAQGATQEVVNGVSAVQSFYQAFRTGDTTLLDCALTADWKDRPLNPGQRPGLEGFKPVLVAYREVFPDLITNHAVVVGGGYVTVRSTFEGTPTAPFLGLAPNGGSVNFRAFASHRLQNGKIAESWQLEDYYGAAAQLGRP